MDNLSKETRSRNISHIPSKNTKPKETLRKYLFSRGFHYRKNVSALLGKLDIVLPKYKTVLFVNGYVFGIRMKNVRGLSLQKLTVTFGRKSLSTPKSMIYVITQLYINGMESSCDLGM